MTISVGDVLRVVSIAVWLDGNINQNVFNATVAGSGGPYDEEDIVDDMLDWVEAMYGNLTSQISDELDGSEVRVYIYDPIDDDWDEVGSVAWVWDPTLGTDQLPRPVAGLINCKTTDPDVNGKKYIGGFTESAITDGLLVPGHIDDLALFAIDWLTGFTGATSTADFQPVIWSPTRTTPFATTGTFLIPTILAYQRRRKRGIGI
jgi:hypothetical protein